MIELILSFLAEIGIIREDYKHRKKISKKEKEDGMKRPIEKYFLQPSSLTVIGVFILGNVFFFLFFKYQKTTIYPENTKKELIEISNIIKQWNEKFGNYPTNLNELIGINPMRQDWKHDSWNRLYKYKIIKNGSNFSLISSGLDGKFGTDDDIKSE